MTVAAHMLDVLAGIEAQTASTSTQEWRQQEAPNFGCSSMFVLDLSHRKLRACITLDHDRKSGKRSVGWVIVDIGLVDEDNSFSESGIGNCLLDFGVVFVDELALAGDGWVDISVGVIDIRHLNW